VPPGGGTGVARLAVADSLPFHYLAVDGPIGVGKTTLVEMLTARFSGVKILEDVANPFLPDFYSDRPGAAFQTELYFLLSRYKQQQAIAQPELFDRFLVSDYTFPKNRIFAYLNLSDDELMLFDKLFTLLEPQVPDPDLVLYLVADLDTCMGRIKKRQRDFERDMSEEYMSELIDAYNHYYHYYNRTPLLVVDTRHLNFVDREEDFEELVRQLERPIKGTQYFVARGPG
jgi:deoxyadenosine/deoxycytidine kinase